MTVDICHRSSPLMFNAFMFGDSPRIQLQSWPLMSLAFIPPSVSFSILEKLLKCSKPCDVNLEQSGTYRDRY